jgi:Cft2 family RNA processing exonuclease
VTAVNIIRFSGEPDLSLPDCGLWLDSRKNRPLCFVSHAHTDHLGRHDLAIATPATTRLAKQRISSTRTIELDVGVDHALAGDLRIRLLHAGHVLGSAMIHVTHGAGTLLYTGDYKLRPNLTTPQAKPEPADVLVMESTFGIPLFRFPPRSEVQTQLVELVAQALDEGVQPIVMGYSLGKAQEIVRIMTDAGIAVTEHGAVAAFSTTYEELGVKLGPRRKYAAADFHGPKALDLLERGVIVAPPQVARSAFVEKFDRTLTIMLSGWGMLKNAPFRYGVDHVLPISDHADFDELIETVERIGPKKIYTCHGYREFADTLRARGWDARPAIPDRQLRLFED